jgi:hypothetical protein
MGYVFDTIRNLTDADLVTLKNFGATGVSRYIARSSGIGKIMYKPECDRIRAHGMPLVVNYEGSAGAWRNGYSQGVADGQFARSFCANTLGINPSVIIASIDTSVATSELPIAAQYCTGFNNGAGGTQGFYGPPNFLNYIADRNLAKVLWQWKGGSPIPRASMKQMYSLPYGERINGWTYDANQQLSAFYGQYPTPGTPPVGKQPIVIPRADWLSHIPSSILDINGKPVNQWRTQSFAPTDRNRIKGNVWHWPGGNDFAFAQRDPYGYVCKIQIDYRTSQARGYDIGYNHIIVPNGNIFECRGTYYKAAAQDEPGDNEDENADWLAIQFAVDLDGKTTPEQDASARWLSGVYDLSYGRVLDHTKGHRDVDAGTVCPGPVMLAKAHAGFWNFGFVDFPHLPPPDPNPVPHPTPPPYSGDPSVFEGDNDMEFLFQITDNPQYKGVTWLRAGNCYRHFRGKDANAWLFTAASRGLNTDVVQYDTYMANQMCGAWIKINPTDIQLPVA